MANEKTGRRIALITGASSGIGAAYAERLAADGYNIALVARRRNRLEEVAKRLESGHGAGSEVLAADLTVPTAVAELGDWAATNPIDILINNAGFAGYRPFVQLETKVADDLLALHIRAVTLLTRAVVPGMVQRRRGVVINVGSLLALSGTIPPNPLPYRAVYAGAKAFILTFTQALALEVKDSGVRLQALLPGVVATEFHASLNLDPNRLASMAMKPEEVVAASLASLEKGELICVPGLDDPSLLDNLGKAQRAVMEAGNRPKLAARYGQTATNR
jgi:short-subunit dehydrogenase